MSHKLEKKKVSAMDEFYKIGFGTWEFGGRGTPNPDNNDAEDIQNIQNALRAGIKHIDTAASYAAGKCEELVGEAIKDFNRQSLFIASKIKADQLNYDNVLKNCELSLKRLGLDYLDLYYIHHPNPQIPIEETAQAFNELHKRGLIKNVGISNAKVETMQKYQTHLNQPIFASQCQYNLIAREPERVGLLEFCRQHHIHFIAWSPIQLPAPALGIEPLYKRGVYPLLDEIAGKYGKKNAQIAIRWLIQQKNINIIFKSTNPEHIQEIIDTQNFSLSDDDMRNLSENFPRQESTSFINSHYRPMI